MPNMLENYGLDFLWESDETMTNFIAYLVKHAKVVPGYCAAPYLYMPMGAVEFWLRTQLQENGVLEVIGIDTHCGGRCVWKLASTDLVLQESNTEPMRRLMIFDRGKDEGGIVPVEVINPDVLPGPLDGDPVEMQVVALPIEISYYASQEEYEAAQPDDKSGRKWIVDNGSFFPSGLLYNHAPDRPEEEKNYDLDGQVLFAATVKGLYYGTFTLDGCKENLFIRCVVDTLFGELEFNHTVDQVPQDLRKNIHVGATVAGVCIISGDVAIGSYENGMVKDLEHNLRALRYSFVHGEAERLRSILTEEAVFYTATSDQTFQGAKAIVERLNLVHAHRKGDYRAYMATITQGDQTHPAGSRCVVLTANDRQGYESIAFMTCNANGMVERIEISTDEKYHFQVDEKPVCQTSTDS